jgi:hypothetical protein
VHIVSPELLHAAAATKCCRYQYAAQRTFEVARDSQGGADEIVGITQARSTHLVLRAMMSPKILVIYSSDDYRNSQHTHHE